jgi:hypothetical protein
MSNLSYLSPKTTVQENPIYGHGLFTCASITQGEIVTIKGGYIFRGAMFREVETRLGPAEIPVVEGFYIGPLTKDGRNGGMIFSNHSCDPNIGIQGQSVFLALRDIRAREELTHDWATTDDDTYELPCHCGAQPCRGIITGQDWRRKDLQAKYRGYIAWDLQKKIDQGQ